MDQQTSILVVFTGFNGKLPVYEQANVSNFLKTDKPAEKIVLEVDKNNITEDEVPPVNKEKN
ncbi:MAG: hypothetical protein AAB477_01345 [Patescibacteria group bacterium]